MAPIEDVLAAPAGMLLISKEGEQERIIYPVHADGWRRLGWQIHTPASLDEEDEDEEPPLLAVDGGEIPDGEGADDNQPPLPPLELERMTKPQIIAAVRERFGLELDLSQTRAELLASVEQLMAADPAVGDGEPEALGEPMGDGQDEGQDDVEALVPSLLI